MKKIVYIVISCLIAYGFSAAYTDQSRIAPVDAAVASCLVYGMQDEGTDDTQPVIYNTVTRTASALGPELDGYNMESVEIHPTTRVVYGVARGGANAGRLLTLDGATGAITVIGNTGSFEISSLAFRKTDNTLWSWEKTTGRLVRINITTGALTQVYVNSGRNDVESLAWNNAGTLLYFTEEDDAALYSYNPSNNAIATVVSALPVFVEGMDTLANNNLIMTRGEGSGTLEIFEYNPVSKVTVQSILIGTTWDDLEGVAYPDTCGGLTSTPSPTPTKTPSPTPTKTPSPTPTKTPTPVPTPTKTPTPVPTATPASGPDCAPNCSTKEIGTIDGFDNFSASSALVLNESYWVRIRVQGPGNLASSTVRVHELINTSYFTLLVPAYGSDPTFKVTKQNGASEEDRTALNCPESGDADTIPDCITTLNYSGTTLTEARATIQNFGANDVYYVYHKVIAKTNGTNVDVDNAASKIAYTGYPSTNPNREVILDNTQATIGGTGSFFQINDGDVYSGSTDPTSAIKSYLPGSSSYFNPSNNAIIFHGGGSTWGNGNVNVKQWEAQPYTITPGNSYSTLYNTYKNYVSPVALTTTGIDAITASGYYIDSTVGAGYKLTLDSKWSGKTVTNKTIIIFVPGDLQIDSSFTVTNNGGSSLIFIVQGNIGINPTVSSVQGIYLADGAIDTSCNSTFTGSECGPDENDSASRNQLTLSGVFVSYNDGFVLDRSSSTSGQPGEIFNYRPDMILASTLGIGQQKFSWKEQSDL
jgi:hypothetical protein